MNQQSDDETSKVPSKKPVRKNKSGKNEELTLQVVDENGCESSIYNPVIALKTPDSHDVVIEEYDWTGQLNTSN